MSESSALFERALDLFRDQEHALQANQEQREALIDLLVWTMFADRKVAVPEQAYIHEQTLGLGWASPRSIGVFIDDSIHRVQGMIGDEAAEASFLDKIGSRLTGPRVRAYAVRACEELIEVDGELAPGELAHLARIREYLNS